MFGHFRCVVLSWGGAIIGVGREVNCVIRVVTSHVAVVLFI